MKVAGTIDLAFDWCQRYWKCSQRSKSRRSMCSRVECARTLVLIDSSELCKVFCVFLFISFLCRYIFGSPSSSSFWLLFPSFFLELVAMLYSLSGSRDMHRRQGLVLILYAAASLKALLPFDFVNTSGQKPSTLRAHFTHPY